MNLTTEDLTALGLTVEDLGLVDSVRRGSDGGAYGFAAAPLDLRAPDVGERLSAVRWARIPAPGAPALGLTVHEASGHPGLLLIAAEDAFTAQTLPPASEALWYPPGEDAEVVIDLGRCRVGAVTCRGQTFLIQAVDGSLEFSSASPKTPLAPPWSVWLEGSTDRWLIERLAAAREPEATDWARAAGAGAWGRLRELEPGAGRALVARLLRGEGSGASAPWGWAATLTPPQRRVLVEAAHDEVDALLGELRALGDEGAVEDPGWRSRLLGVLHRRDVLQSVLKVLVEAGEVERVRAIPAQLDATGAQLLSALPRLEELGGDPWLLRAARVEPDGWWTRPVADAGR